MQENALFEQINNWAKNEAPVFILGPERSGTSMMFRTIISHPSFCSFKNATVETFSFIKPYQLLDLAAADAYEMRVYAGNQQAAFEKAITSIKQINNSCDKSGLSRSYFNQNRQQIWRERKYKELLRAFFYFSWLNLGKLRLAEKTPAHVRCIDEIMQCFPRAKLLICLRNPLEVIASHRKRLAREIELGKTADDPSLEWLGKSVEQYLGYFAHINVLVSRAQRKFPASIKLVPYSKITTSTEFLEEVFDFIGEDVTGIQSEQNTPSDKTLEWDPLLASLPKENVLDWKPWLTKEEVDLVSIACSQTSLGAWR